MQEEKETPLYGAEAIAHIKDVLNGGKQTVMVLSALLKPPAHVRPLAVNKVDDEGALWFLSARDADGHQQVLEQGHAQIIYADPSSYQFITLYGRMEEVEGVELREELWTPIAKTWFKEGPQDPRMGILRFSPTSGHYWDTKHGKTISLLKFAASAVLGVGGDDGGEQGDLKV